MEYQIPQNADAGQDWLTTHEAGSRPFAMAHYSANQEIQLKRYADYWAFDKERPLWSFCACRRTTAAVGTNSWPGTST
ncbi:hypothetical protein ABZT45_24345 [Streptomyces sp. NPDC005356]|uniref:hypothetical protein n=1 Tax=Streptomyces sp. NPDC005356 TaxID=3157167 RepID=UPI0033A6D4F3